MACKALNFMAISMGFMKFYTVILMFFSLRYLLVSQENLLGIGEVVTVKAYFVVYFARLLYFLLVAGIFTACFVGNKLRMVN